MSETKLKKIKRKKKGDGSSQDEGGGHKKRGLVIPVNYKTQLCRNYEAEKKCPYGRRCVFAHDLCELRTIQINMVAMAQVAMLRAGKDPYYGRQSDQYGYYYPQAYAYDPQLFPYEGESSDEEEEEEEEERETPAPATPVKAKSQEPASPERPKEDTDDAPSESDKHRTPEKGKARRQDDAAVPAGYWYYPYYPMPYYVPYFPYSSDGEYFPGIEYYGNPYEERDRTHRKKREEKESERKKEKPEEKENEKDADKVEDTNGHDDPPAPAPKRPPGIPEEF
eukprot:TRINITY_DN355_c0_g1_i1.p1 TRINITY_DN355_c0_g1~~TRINITY_DN355_c0_g1_i1.p1  ORF type:complete len:289 (+),score=51.26 TRINITY_DN355_c0_g1_i1:30-869(+)